MSERRPSLAEVLRKAGTAEGLRNARLPFGVQRRNYLYDGEKSFFRANPHIAGMAADDNRVVLNPWSKNSASEQEAVALNEAARVFMRQQRLEPGFALTPQQEQFFAGTAYEGAPVEKRQTLAARLLSGDPSAGEPTAEQRRWVDKWLRSHVAAKRVSD